MDSKVWVALAVESAESLVSGDAQAHVKGRQA